MYSKHTRKSKQLHSTKGGLAPIIEVSRQAANFPSNLTYLLTILCHITSPCICLPLKNTYVLSHSLKAKINNKKKCKRSKGIKSEVRIIQFVRVHIDLIFEMLYCASVNLHRARIVRMKNFGCQNGNVENYTSQNQYIQLYT